MKLTKSMLALSIITCLISAWCSLWTSSQILKNNFLEDKDLSEWITSQKKDTIFYCSNLYSDCSPREHRHTQGSTNFPPALASWFLSYSWQKTINLDSLELPINNNISSIYFDSSEANSSEFVSDSGIYSIQGKVINTLDTIEVIRDGDNKSYFLQQFQAGDQKFTYNIAPRLWNISSGTNYYLIRWYRSPNLVFERIFTVHYRTRDQDIILQESQETNFEEDIDMYYSSVNCPIWFNYYSSESGHYTLWISPYTLSRQIMKFEDWTQLIYQITPDNSFELSRNDSNWNVSNIKNYHLLCDIIAWAEVITEDPNYIIIRQYYHEDANDSLIYKKKDNQLISINDDLLIPALWKNNFYPVYEFSIANDTIKITEIPYCCDRLVNPNGYEEFVFDLTTDQLLSTRKLPNPYPEE